MSGKHLHAKNAEKGFPLKLQTQIRWNKRALQFRTDSLLPALLTAFAWGKERAWEALGGKGSFSENCSGIKWA